MMKTLGRFIKLSLTLWILLWKGASCIGYSPAKMTKINITTWFFIILMLCMINSLPVLVTISWIKGDMPLFSYTILMSISILIVTIIDMTIYGVIAIERS